MKKFLSVLLLLSFFAVFSTPARAVDLKFSGEFYAAHMFLDKTSLTKDVGSSTAFFYQRLRVRTDFVVSPGLTLVTRFDALERAWGATRSTPGTTLVTDSAGTEAENENIAFDWAYINYKSTIGTFDVGMMNDGSTGTIFGNSLTSAGRIKYSYPIGPLTLNAAYTKVKEGSFTRKNAATTADADNDKYGLEAIYNWKGGKAGAQVNYYHYANSRPAATPYERKYYLITPYAIAKIGPVALQAELNYATGDDKYENGAADVDIENWSGWIDATATFGMVYFGASIAYVSGDDPNSADKKEGGIINGGRDWSPTLIMWNYDRAMWAGNLESTATTGSGFRDAFANGFLYQGRVGVKPIEKLDIMASFTYANADKKPANYVSGEYGYEFDLTATYKITNNLSYMLGVGYLWTGDYFKGTGNSNQVEDDYLVINKLTLTF